MRTSSWVLKDGKSWHAASELVVPALAALLRTAMAHPIMFDF